MHSSIHPFSHLYETLSDVNNGKCCDTTECQSFFITCKKLFIMAYLQSGPKTRNFWWDARPETHLIGWTQDLRFENLKMGPRTRTHLIGRT